MRLAPQVTWPKPGRVELDVSQASKVPGAPVWIERTAGSGVSRARVEVLDQAATPSGYPLAMRVEAVSGSGGVRVKLGYRDFANAYGGDWARRARLVSIPCEGCRPQELATVNDRDAFLLSAEVPAGSMVALTAGPSSDGGTYAATPFQATSSWSGGEQSGDFTWAYPMRVPPALGGPEPAVGLSYSSQSLDGRTAANNSQPSWVGDGFDFSPGAIERSYKACVDDGKTGIGDLCWGTDNATISLPGHSGELIQVSSNPDIWKIDDDDGTLVERLTNTVNGDNNNEHWKVSTIDGKQYFFGLNRLPGRPSNGPETNSALTVPVYGNNAGEPCYSASGFSSSWCVQAYRWMLDYVIDSHGNTMSYWYTKELNHYARNVTDTAVSEYVKAVNLDHIDYGTRNDGGIDSVFAVKAPARVAFGLADRCLTPGSTCTTAYPANWPDAPLDQNCSSTTNCTGRYTPAFFSMKRLSTVTTQVVRAGNYADVERWTMTQVFKDPGDGHAKTLFLSKISRVGVNNGLNTPTPDVTFNGVQLNNRVDKSPTKDPIIRFRVSSIGTEAGGTISVNYSAPECVLGTNMPASADNNTKRCYPVYWTPYNATSPTWDWFHKYVVQSVSIADGIGGAPAEVFSYTYSSTVPMWHFDHSELVKPTHKSWGEWRGYSKVRSIHGAAGSAQQQTDTIFYQGMHGDKKVTGTRTVTIAADPDFGGAAVNDEDQLAGQVRETIAYNGVGDSAPVVAKTLNLPWSYGPTVTRTRLDVTTSAYVLNTRQTTTLTALDGGRGWRKTQSTNRFDGDDGVVGPIGLITQIDDAGDTTVTTDNKCTRYTYATNASRHMRTVVAQVETVAVACAVTPDRSTDIITDNRVWYDGATSFDKVVTKGDPTRTELLTNWNSGTPLYAPQTRTTYDQYGRVRTQLNALGRSSETAYSPDTGGPVTGLTVTDAKDWDTVSTVDPGYGNTTSSVDMNNRRTDSAYDGLGMLTSVWLPGRDKATKSASMVYTYNMTPGSGRSVSSSVLNTGGTGYVTSWLLYDGLLRPRQTQNPAPGGGRIITDTLFNSLGQTVQTNSAYFNAGSPGGTLFTPTGAVPGRTLSTYDNAGRPIASIFQVNGAERSRVTRYQGGDHVDLTVPAGSTASSVWADAAGRTTKLVLYHGTTPTGASETVEYDYYPDGQLKYAKDAALYKWEYFYDQRGKLRQSNDPDKGTSYFTYDDLGQLTNTKDAYNNELFTKYDELGRKKALYQGIDDTGLKLADWTYDTLVLGRISSSTRYEGNRAYTSSVTGYDINYRPLGTTVTIPAFEGALAGTYTTSTTYNVNGSPYQVTLPQAGTMAPETLTYGYGSLGHLTTLSGTNTYLTGASYDSLGRPGAQTRSNGGAKTLTEIWNYEEGTERLAEHATYDEAAGQVFQDAFYGYDASGNVTSIKDLMAQYGGVDDKQCFKLDYYRRLERAWTPTDGNCGTAPTAWSQLGGPAPYWQAFTYDDKTGNRKTVTDYSASGSATLTSTYPLAGQARPHGVKAVSNGDTFDYDAAGNTWHRNIAGKPAQTMTWDSEGHLAKVADTNGETSYLYDANGARLIARTPTGNTLYLGDQEVKAVGTTTSTVRRYGSYGVRTTADGLMWMVSDHHGTGQIAFRAADLAVTQRRTKPFGESRGGNPVWPTKNGFIGGPADDTGLTHLGAREYDPAAGRFLSADPLMDTTDPLSWNAYGYSHHNPVTGSDPSGLSDKYRRYRVENKVGHFTEGGYTYHFRYEVFLFCSSNGTCLGRWVTPTVYRYKIEVHITIIRVPAYLSGPVYVPSTYVPWDMCARPHPVPRPPDVEAKFKVWKLRTKVPQTNLNPDGKSESYCLTDDPDCLRLLAENYSHDPCEEDPGSTCGWANAIAAGSFYTGVFGPLCPPCDVVSTALGVVSGFVYFAAGEDARGVRQLAATGTGVFLGSVAGKAAARSLPAASTKAGYWSRVGTDYISVGRGAGAGAPMCGWSPAGCDADAPLWKAYSYVYQPD